MQTLCARLGGIGRREDATLHLAAHDGGQRFGWTTRCNKRNLSFETQVLDADAASNVGDRAEVGYTQRPTFELVWPLDRRLDPDGLAEPIDEPSHEDEVRPLEVSLDDLLRADKCQRYLAALNRAHHRRTGLNTRERDVESLLIEVAALFGCPQRRHGGAGRGKGGIEGDFRGRLRGPANSWRRGLRRTRCRAARHHGQP